MKYFPLILIFGLFLAFAVSAQTNQNSSCPTIDVSGGGAVRPGDTMTFAANIGGIDSKTISYQWSVSSGTIISGQGAPVIEVDTTGLTDENITATVEIKDLPEGCDGKRSEVGAVSRGCGLPITIDKYGRLPFREEKARLNAVALELEKNKNAMAVFIFYITGRDSRQALEKRILNISKYLNETHKIPKERFKILSGGTMDSYITQIYLTPVNSLK
jgi:hypothetical protein